MPDVVSLDTLKTILQTDLKYRERRHPDWTENYLLYRLRVITNRLTQRQSMNVPYVKETIRALVAKTSIRPDIYFKNLGNNKDRELLMNEYWLECARQNKLHVLDIVDRKQEGLYGRSNMKLTIQNGRLVFMILDPQDVLFDRFMSPWDTKTARHITHTGIMRTLSELERNPLYDKEAIKRLKVFFATKAGIIKSNDNSEMLADKADRMRKMGVPDVMDPQVGETYVEINETQIWVPDEKEEKDILWVESVAENEKLSEKRMQDVLHINRFNICTWAGDVEATDIYSDGVADIARPMNQMANVRVSQKAENGTLINYGMQFYDTRNLPEGWSPVGYEPSPFGFYGLPLSPNEDLRRVDIPEMREVFQELDWYKSQIESATATTPVSKGEASEGDQTKYEIQLLAAEAKNRITSSAPLSDQYWEDIAELFADIVNGNPDVLDVVKLYKEDQEGNFWPREVDPAELTDSEGWKVRITSKAKKDAEALESIQKFRVAKTEFPANIPLQKATKEAIVAWLDVNPEVSKEILDFEDQNPMANPLLSAPVKTAAPSAAGPINPNV